MEGPVRCTGGCGADGSAGVNGHVHTARGRSAATKRHVSDVLCTYTANMEVRKLHSKIFPAFRTEKLD